MIDNEVKTEIINKYKKHLVQAKDHTQYKIKYVKDYVNRWLMVFSHSNKDNAYFIDCMCNAGIYKNDIVGTCIEILELFCDYANKFKDKHYYLYLNDYDKYKIDALKELIRKSNIFNQPNLHICIENKDVRVYLNELTHNNYLNKKSLILLYVDPYNFGIQGLINSIKGFINHYYCELLYNFFTSDIKRNIENKYVPNKMENIKNEIEYFTDDEVIVDRNMAENLVNQLRSDFKSRYIKYAYPYKFETVKNVEIYYIVFFTPSKKGLEKIKESIWYVFKGNDYFNIDIARLNEGQQSLFDSSYIYLDTDVVKKDVLEYLKYNEYLNYEDIEMYVLENSLLMESHVLKNIIMPLLDEGKIERIIPDGKRANNYKDCTYKYVY